MKPVDFETASSASRKARCLYLATFDPTVSTTGTATRGKIFLRHFASRYETHLVHMKEVHSDGCDLEVTGQLASAHALPYSQLGYFFFSRRLLKTASRVARETRPDFIFADFEKSGLYAHILSRTLQVPYFYNSHNVEYKRYVDFARTSKLRYAFVPLVYFVERLACRNASLTVAISQPDGEILRGWVPDGRLLVLPCAIDEDAFRPDLDAQPDEPPVVLMVGNYRNPGNREGACAVCRVVVPAVAARRPDVVFRFVGKAFPDALKHPNVQAVGFSEDLPREYARASVIIAPITIGGGIKIKVVEALSVGKPLVATPKAMEGIDPGGLENVWVEALKAFPDRIVEVLDKRPPTTCKNWKSVSRAYGSRVALEGLTNRIDSLLASARGDAPARPPSSARRARSGEL